MSYIKFWFQVSLENGIVLKFDARTLPSDLSKPSPSRFMLAAHDGAASALDVNPHIRGCIITGGTDKMVKVWNVNDKSDGKKDVSLVISRDLGVVCFVPSRFSVLISHLDFYFDRARFSRLHSRPMIRSLLQLPDQRRSYRSGMWEQMLVRAKLSLRS